MEYGQFCPVAKAAELLGERWTLLIIRELLMGSRRFNEFQRGLSHISPAVLTKRLNDLADHHLLEKRKIPGQRGFEYVPTQSATELTPILLGLGEWGMKWTRDNLSDNDYDVELLMLYLQRSIDTEVLGAKQTTVRFHFTDFEESAYWWILVDSDAVDVCTLDPGKDVDVYFTTTVKAMLDAWTGKISYRDAIGEKKLIVVGDHRLTRNISRWMQPCIFSAQH